MEMDVARKIKNLYEASPIANVAVRKINELAKEVSEKTGEKIKIMNFCGTHEWTITYYGLRSLMPEEIELIAGPGCPVCITPGHYVKGLINLAMEGINVFTYGDAYKLPSLHNEGPRSLAHAKALGGKVTIIYSFLDAIREAQKRKEVEHVFFAVGFETTMPAITEPLLNGAVPENLKVLCAHRLTPPIMRYLLTNVKDVDVSGIIAPGHVSAIVGAKAWSFIPEEFGIPTVVSGFEPVDILISILEILKQLKKRTPSLINEYTRVVKWEGNRRALRDIENTFDIVDAYWRGIGVVNESGAVLKERFKEFDASLVYGIKEKADFSDVMPGCRCGEVSLGKIKPTECPLFMKVCKPETPWGPCMVSSEGTCKIWAENMPQALSIKF